MLDLFTIFVRFLAGEERVKILKQLKKTAFTHVNVILKHVPSHIWCNI